MWINVKDRLPSKKNKCLVVVDCDGKEEITLSQWIPRKNKFNFDMVHINWKVIKWYDTDERTLLIKFCNWLKNKDIIKSDYPTISYELAEMFIESKVKK